MIKDNEKTINLMEHFMCNTFHVNIYFNHILKFKILNHILKFKILNHILKLGFIYESIVNVYVHL